MPCCSAARSLRLTMPSFSSKKMRRSYWPTRAYWVRPLSIRKLTSPVNPPVAGHLEQLLLALLHTQVRHAPLRHEGQVAECADYLPVLLLGHAHLGKPIRSRQERGDELQLELVVSQRRSMAEALFKGLQD